MGHLGCLRNGIVRGRRGSQRGKRGKKGTDLFFAAKNRSVPFFPRWVPRWASKVRAPHTTDRSLPMKMTTIVDNGVNVEALLGARQALTDMPEAAQFKWRAGCEWVRGTHSRSTVQTFFGLGTEHSHKTAFAYDTDHPAVFASEDKGSTPVEMVLVGLAGCLTAGIAAVAQN